MTVPTIHYDSQDTEFPAEQLAHYLSAMAGKHFGIELDASLPANCLTINSSAQGNPEQLEQFVVIGEKDSLSIRAGSIRAALYGVYSLLEYLGCRWPRPGQDLVPKKQPDFRNVRIEDAPKFRWRGLCFDYTQVTSEIVDWMAKMRFNTLNVCWSSFREPHWPGNDIFVQAKRRGLICMMGGHCQEDILDLNDLYKSHPEYFALLGAKRVDPTGKGVAGWRLCHSNPEIANVVAQALIKVFKEIPQLDGFSIWDNDGYGNWCECENCLKLDPETQRYDFERGYPVRTERILHFVQQLDRIIRQSLPGKFFEFGAVYENSLPPLREEVFPSNENVLFHCGYEFCYRHGYDEPCNRERMDRSVDGWIEQCGINSRAFSYYNDAIKNSEIPVSLITKIVNDAQSVQRCGLNGFHDLITASYVEELFDRWAVNLHAMSRFWWNPNASVETFLDEFLTQYYGSAAEEMRAYHQWIEAETRRPGEGTYLSFNEDWRHDPAIHSRGQANMDADFFRCTNDLLAKGLAAATDERSIQRIKALVQAWNVTELFFKGQETLDKDERKRIAEEIWKLTGRTAGREDPRYYGFVIGQTKRWLAGIGQWETFDSDVDGLIAVG